MDSVLAFVGILIVGLVLWRIAVAIRHKFEREQDETEGGVGGQSDRKPAKH